MVKFLRMIALLVTFLLVQAWMWIPARAAPIDEGARAVRSLDEGLSGVSVNWPKSRS